MTIATALTSFTELALIQPLLARVTELGYQQPTPIQGQVIPNVLAGRHVIAGANTGQVKPQHLRFLSYKSFIHRSSQTKLMVVVVTLFLHLF